MTYKALYELPLFSTNLEKEPDIKIQDMDVTMKISGYDEEDFLHHVTLKFDSVLGMKHTSSNFTVQFYDSYDKVVEIKDSKWLQEFKEMNEDEFLFWKPKHFALYLDDMGLYQFIAQSFVVE